MRIVLHTAGLAFLGFQASDIGANYAIKMTTNLNPELINDICFDMIIRMWSPGFSPIE